jgi:hypothetical protein
VKYSVLIIIITLITAVLIVSPGQASGISKTSLQVPVISISKVNTTTVKKYEKFELWLNLEHVKFDNPFDPEQVDVYALFKSPSGEEIRINGFYDDYDDAGQWKVRFSPRETGEYRYTVYVKSNELSGKTADSTLMRLIRSTRDGLNSRKLIRIILPTMMVQHSSQQVFIRHGEMTGAGLKPMQSITPTFLPSGISGMAALLTAPESLRKNWAATTSLNAEELTRCSAYLKKTISN